MTELTIGELSERSGIAASAIRYYEDRGLVWSRRTTGNQRRYERPMLRRLAFIRTAPGVGLSLEEIEEALATLPSNRSPVSGSTASERGLRKNTKLRRLTW
jgi:MerR family transcriptional regulator, redox-sensitive transcriptional activator SoxR